MESFSQPSVKLAAGGLALIALIAFAMGFKESFVRPSEAAGHYALPTEPASSLGEPTPAQAFTEPVPGAAAQPAPSFAAAKAAKPKPATVDDLGDNSDESAAPAVAKPASSAPASVATTPIVTPPKPAAKTTSKVAAPTKATPPASAAPNAKSAPDSIDDLLPPH